MVVHPIFSCACDWRDIEQWLLTWQSRPGEFMFTEPWMTIAWYAVQESWRLALLSYLYLAVCDACSDDPRIQSCVTQLLPVIGTVKKRESSGAEVSFFIQYLIAGICARTETHRRIVRDTLTGTNEPRFWVMRGSDFVPVLDHLWHGAASGGRPIRRGVSSTAEPPLERLVIPKPTEENFPLHSSRAQPGCSEETVGSCGGTSIIPDLPPRKDRDEPSLCVTRPVYKSRDIELLAFRRLSNLHTQIPYSPSDPLKTFVNNPLFDNYLFAQRNVNSAHLGELINQIRLVEEKLLERWYFRPTNSYTKGFQQGVMSRLRGPLATSARWIAFIGMGICEAILTGDVSQIQLHNLWIQHVESTLKRELSHDTTSGETRERRSDWVHISLLKTMVMRSASTYQLLRSITPTFLQVVYSDPALWPRDCNPACVPLSSILCSEAHELAYFAFIDITCSTALGLPQQLEYDTTIRPESKSSSVHQWAQGSPTEFLLVLADINACRDESPNARDWREIEHWLLEWQSRPGEHTFTESWMTIAWYAVQESWRLALLSYLYLAVCNIPSDDPRIQSCMRQMLQVVGTVKKRKSSGTEVSFLVQYLIAGICAQSEKHRRMVRNVLGEDKVTKFWIMRGSDFVPVLDYLWHGAAAGGRPVKWSDYMRSREAALPVTL
ncbi:unnamed protein product [Rhizoctonia solani]|uniref:Uncharacterized protein n=1 Tax=Rhizoctonia solani TaxID=456999 RepID=A0A8H3GEV0_9AGAM|nr:unnamed protein product [Rhizoctonia solani]